MCGMCDGNRRYTQGGNPKPPRELAAGQPTRNETPRMPTSFKEYLKGRRRAYTPQGDVVDDLQRDPDFPDPTSWTELKRYLVRRGADGGVVEAARSVWRQYLLRKGQQGSC